jgi:hypothetical protein
MKRKYDAKYFLQFFRKIPSKAMGSGSIGAHCALYHLNGGSAAADFYTDTPEVQALARIIQQVVPATKDIHPHVTVYALNDAGCYLFDKSQAAEIRRLGRTPKARFLKVLGLALKAQSKRKTRKEKAQ